MADERERDNLERIVTALAESVLKLPDEAILAETNDAGANPQDEAERTRSVLRHAAQNFEYVNKRLSDLGHAVNPKTWSSGRGGYQNRCLNCGLIVMFALTNDLLRNQALNTRCSAMAFRAMIQTGNGS